MAHEITVREDGFAEIALREKAAWHGLGQVVGAECDDSESMIASAGMDWRVGLDTIQTVNGIEIPGMFATIRRDNNSILGVVTDRYKVVQNRDAFKFLDSLVEDGQMRYESCGSLQGGKKIFVLARMPSIDEIAENDPCARYLLFTTGHDGKTALDVVMTSTRVVCANTLRIARQTDCKMTIKHKGDMRTKLDDARKWASQFDQQFLLFRDNARLLATRQVSPVDAKEYVDKLFPMPLESDGRAATIRANKLTAMRNAFRFERNQIASIKGTWWQLLNALTDSVDHADRASDTLQQREKTFVSLIDGTAADFKESAFKLAMGMSA